MVLVSGEITSNCYVDIPQIVRSTIRNIGYEGIQGGGFDCDTCSVLTSIDEQSCDIAGGVNKALEAKENQIDIIDLFFKLREQVYKHFDFVEDWVVYALEDYRDYYWELPYGEGLEGEVHYAETIEDLKDKEAGHYYCNDIYTQRFYDKWVYRAEDYTFIFCDTHVDGNKFFGIYDNKKEVKADGN